MLQRFAERASADQRAGDLLARWGGEEFSLVMSSTTQTEARGVLEQLRQRIANGDLGDIATGVNVSFSAVVASGGPGEASVQVLERIDLALYRAKHAGRDRAESA